MIFLRIAIGFSLAPQQQCIFGGFLLRTFILVLVNVDFNFLDKSILNVNDFGHPINSYLDLEAEDDSPDESEDHSGVAVHNVLRSDVLQPDLGVEEGQALVDVLHPVDPHLPTVRLAELLSGDDLQQLQQLSPVR